MSHIRQLRNENEELREELKVVKKNKEYPKVKFLPEHERKRILVTGGKLMLWDILPVVKFMPKILKLLYTN